MLLGIPLKELACGPLDGEKVHSGSGFADLDGLHHVRMLDSLPIPSLPHKPGNGRLVLTKLLAQDLDGDYTMNRVLGTEDSGRSTLSNLATQRIASQRSTNQILFRHAANLTSLRTPVQA